MKKKISQSQLILPLLDAIEERGGAAKARDVYDLVAEKVDLPADERAARITISGQSYNAFEREVRWANKEQNSKGSCDRRMRACGHSRTKGSRLSRRPLLASSSRSS
jgi:restriction endonuclease Mrr